MTFWNGRNEWKRLEGVDYLNNAIYQHIKTGELAWEERDYLVALPADLERQLQEKLNAERQKDAERSGGQ